MLGFPTPDEVKKLQAVKLETIPAARDFMDSANAAVMSLSFNGSVIVKWYPNVLTRPVLDLCLKFIEDRGWFTHVFDGQRDSNVDGSYNVKISKDPPPVAGLGY